MSDSIREELTKAFAASPPVEETISKDPPSPESTVSEGETSAPTKDADGNTPLASSGSTAQPKATDTSVASGQAPGQGSPPQSAAPAATSDPAPASWKADEKEAWASLPANAKAAIKRREADTQRALSTSAGARKLEANFQTALTPYQKMLEAKGVKDPMSEVVAPILEIRRILEAGTPQQKAHAVFNMITQFKVDVNTLDEYLVKGAPQGPFQGPQQAPQFDLKSVPELAPLFALAAERQQAEDARLDGMIAEISSDPLYEELREDTAAVLKAFAERETPISLKDAFNRAKLLRPDLSPVITQNSGSGDNSPARGADGKFVAANLDASRRAAKSVSGAPKSTPGEKTGGSIRDDLLAAMETHS